MVLLKLAVESVKSTGESCVIDSFGFYVLGHSADQNPAPEARIASSSPSASASTPPAALVRKKKNVAQDDDDDEDDLDVTLHIVLKQQTRRNDPLIQWWSEMIRDANEDAASVRAALKAEKARLGASRHSSSSLREGEGGETATALQQLHRKSTSRGDSWSCEAVTRMRQRIRHRALTMIERKLAWPYFSGFAPSSNLRSKYEKYLAEPMVTDLEEVLLRDLGRTLPTHCLFKGADSEGQKCLRRILHAYSNLDREVGYCQGMGFIAAVLLLHMDELSAFGVFVQVMQGRQYRMRELFQDGFPLLQKLFDVFRHLLKTFLPRLWYHFEELNIDVAFFASHWFLTLFAYQFPVPLVARIWDLFLSEGWKWIFKVAVALLSWDESLLLSMRMEGVLLHLKCIHEGKSPSDVLSRAMVLPIRERDLKIPMSAVVASAAASA